MSLSTSGKFPREFANGKLHVLVLPDGLGRIALHHLIGSGDARCDATLGSHFGAVGDFDVAVDAHLPSNHTMGPNLGGSRDSRLGRDHSVLSDPDVVGHLYEVVQFHAFIEDGGSQSGPVNGGACSNFTSGSYGDIAQLRDFFKSRISRGKPKPVGANGGANLKDAMVSDRALVSNDAPHAQNDISANAAAMAA